MIKLSDQIISQINAHGEETYPYECCGALIGERKDGSEMVTEIRRLTNTNKQNPKRRYSIDPIELMELEEEIDEKGLDMLGIYHSHPDHPAKPSEYDLNHAWPNLTYIVLKVSNGESTKITAWELSKNGDRFTQKELINGGL